VSVAERARERRNPDATSDLGDDCFRIIASIPAPNVETPAGDDDQECRRRRLLLGKGAVVGHRMAHPLAAELDDEE
jgi:hypothetical protein